MKFTKSVFLACLLCTSMNFASANETSDILSSKVSGSGEDVVLIPGLMSDSRVWQQTVDELAKNYRVHQLSIAGFGNQPYAVPLRQQFIKPVTEAVNNYLSEQTSGDAALVGHSLGGFIGYKLALKDTPNASCVVAVDGVPFFSALVTMNPALTAKQAEPQARQLLSAYQQLSAPAMARQAAAGASRQTTSSEGKQKITTMAESSDPKTVGRAMYELMTTDLRPQLNQLKVPVLQMAATGAFPQTQRSSAMTHYQKQVSGSDLITLVEFDQARHFIMWDQPQAFIQQTTDFIKERCHAQ
ncbi:alpha/beta fold hydrolase [Idiomarina ramblicola]|uniref:Alpha/beta hydrolase n=1 Tax=Idiomarina ramblicola TaxID=263724 RepID=A0A432YUH1_9GAMM|nr:alpha/beta hydrolase [Idiomarina ramblicola]RUO66962.1 alpha/beta hydrolase [Idiomarina ramblicola]